ncbi:alanine racemase [Candidatus Parcubacteria bacterium]|nr:MAG: alanine racemase [Candidatus Parcubacteria bacterium]
METRSWVEVDIKALLHNVKSFRKLAPKSELMAIVKSNAYGHGLVGAAKIFLKGGANWFGVDSMEEAVALRLAKIKQPILILGYVPISDLKYLFEYNLRAVIYNLESLIKFGRIAKKKNVIFPVHLKIETGTNRQGIAFEDIADFLEEFVKNKNISLEGLSTHFANAEDASDLVYAKKQLNNLEKAVNIFKARGFYPKFIHCAASAAALVFPQSHFNLIRPGISLYGLWPSEETKIFVERKNGLFLKPTLSWKVKIAQVKKLRKGSFVGYNLTEKVKKDSKVAVLPVGYWDGYDRGLSSVGEVLISGKRAKVLGRVCMNMIMVDVTNISKAGLEKTATLIGKDLNEIISAEELAEKIDTISYEVVSRINPLLKRIYK